MTDQPGTATTSLPPPAASPAAVPSGPEPFVVTSPTTAIALGAERRGQVAVSVTNVTGRPLRARLRLQPDAPAESAWFGVTGGDEREFLLGATLAYTVQVAVPASAPPGRYRLRCDAVAEERPDEIFTIGPTVEVSVPEVREHGRFPRWIIAAIAVVVVLVTATIAVVATQGGGKPVPGVINHTGTSAVATLTNAGFEPTDIVTTGDCDPPVIDQDPAPLEEADAGTRVVLTFGECGDVEAVPFVIGTGFGEGSELINATRFDVELAFVGQSLECGPNIVGQSPQAGTRISTGSVVILAVPREPSSCGPPAGFPEVRADVADVFPQFKGFD